MLRGSDRCPQCKTTQFRQQVLQLRRAQGSSNRPSVCEQHTLPHGSTLLKNKYPAWRRQRRDSQGPEERPDEGLIQTAVKETFGGNLLNILVALHGGIWRQLMGNSISEGGRKEANSSSSTNSVLRQRELTFSSPVCSYFPVFSSQNREESF